MLGWFPFHCFQLLLPASTASRAASEGWWRKRALAASLVQLGRSSFLAAVNQTRRRCGLMVIGGKTREEERLPCHRGWGRLWRPWRLLQCSGGSIQGVVNVFREPLWRTDDVWRLLFRLPSQAKLPRRRKLGAFPTNYGTPRKAFKLSFSMPCHRSSLLPSTTTTYILKLLCFCGTPLCYVVWLCYAIYHSLLGSKGYSSAARQGKLLLLPFGLERN